MDKNDEVSEFRAALYARMATKHQQYSTDNQGDGLSLPASGVARYCRAPMFPAAQRRVQRAHLHGEG